MPEIEMSRCELLARAGDGLDLFARRAGQEGYGRLRGELCRPEECLVHGGAAAGTEGYAAHTLVLFEFAGDRVIGLTVEARREADEKYDAFGGLFNKFELAYIWSTAKELLTRRAVFLKKEICVYPLQLSGDSRRRDFLRRCCSKRSTVSTKPRFYNTFISNCTNELGKDGGDAVALFVGADRLFAAVSLQAEIHPGARFRERAHQAK